MNARTRTIVIGVIIAVLAGVVAYLVFTLPIEQVLGTRIRLPIFHGALTWVNLMTFTIMGVVALAHLLLRRPAIYGWESGLRWTSIAMWAIGSGLGLIAALNTWDFTGSQRSPLSVAMQDPRLVAQFWVLIGAGVLLIAQLAIDNRTVKSLLDMGFVVALWAILAPVFIQPEKRALHPDSPVLNSGWDIKAPFFLIVVCLFAIALLVSWLIGQAALRASASDVQSADELPA